MSRSGPTRRVPAQWTTRTVRAVWRGADPWRERKAEVVTVEIRWVCPAVIKATDPTAARNPDRVGQVCNGPRGEPKPEVIRADGASLTFDRWRNPCAHLDLQCDVVLEGRAFAAAKAAAVAGRDAVGQ